MVSEDFPKRLRTAVQDAHWNYQVFALLCAYCLVSKARALRMVHRRSAAGRPLHIDGMALYEEKTCCMENTGTRIFVGEKQAIPEIGQGKKNAYAN